LSHWVFRLFCWDVSRCFLLSEAFSIQFQWIFLSKNSLKPLELTFLICYYRQVFKPIKKLTLSCFVSLSIPTFSLGCFEMFLVIWSVLDTISMDFSTKNLLKPLELTFLSWCYRQVFKSMKKLTLSCFVSLSIPTFLLGCFEMFLVFWSVLDTISMDFFKQKFIETTRTDISKLLLSSRF
jgi:hypothetical protein